jgi:hypothetical protein
MQSQREARLRPEYASLYPYLTPGAWDSAAVLTDRVVADLLGRPEGRFIIGSRVLDPAHFDFRGSEARPPATSRRRQDS